MKTKIFITGITSDIMRKFCTHVDYDKYEVIGLTRRPENEHIENVKLVKGDIQRPADFSGYLDGCQIIIHAAAITHSFKSKPYFEINVEATKQLVSQANEKGVERFIYISSNTAAENSGSYGLTKLLAEKYIQQHCGNWSILRLSEVFGSDKKEGIDELIDQAIAKSFLMCPTGVPFKFFPIHIDDTVTAIQQHVFQNQRNLLTVINGHDGYTFQEIVQLVESVSQKSIRTISLSKNILFFIKSIVKWIPFHIGIIPDQIDRLYGTKHHESNSMNLLSLEAYIQQLVDSKRGIKQ